MRKTGGISTVLGVGLHRTPHKGALGCHYRTIRPRKSLSQRRGSSTTEPLFETSSSGDQYKGRAAESYGMQAWNPPCRQPRATVPPALLPRHRQPQQGLGEVVRDPLAHRVGQQADTAPVHQRPDVFAVERGHNLVRGCVEADVLAGGKRQKKR